MKPDELKAWRAASGVSQGELAKLAGVSTRAVQFWEAGRSAIPFAVAVLCAASSGKVDAWRTAAAKVRQNAT